MSATTQPNSPSLHAHPHACAALAEALFNDPFYQAVTIDHAANTVRRLQVLAHYCALAMDEAPARGDGPGGGPPRAAPRATRRQGAIQRPAHPQLAPVAGSARV